MLPIRNPFKNAINNFFRRLKSGQLALDEFSLFLIVTALLSVFVLMFFNLHRYAYLAWIPLLVAYWRTFSKKRINRYKENLWFVKYYYPVNSFIKTQYRRFTAKENFIFFACKKCQTTLRIPKKTGHIKVTCPKCKNAFVKKTIRGHLKRLKRKMF